MAGYAGPVRPRYEPVCWGCHRHGVLKLRWNCGSLQLRFVSCQLSILAVTVENRWMDWTSGCICPKGKVPI